MPACNIICTSSYLSKAKWLHPLMALTVQAEMIMIINHRVLILIVMRMRMMRVTMYSILMKRVSQVRMWRAVPLYLPNTTIRNKEMSQIHSLTIASTEMMVYRLQLRITLLLSLKPTRALLRKLKSISMPWLEITNRY